MDKTPILKHFLNYFFQIMNVIQEEGHIMATEDPQVGEVITTMVTEEKEGEIMMTEIMDTIITEGGDITMIAMDISHDKMITEGTNGMEKDIIMAEAAMMLETRMTV